MCDAQNSEEKFRQLKRDNSFTNRKNRLERSSPQLFNLIN